MEQMIIETKVQVLLPDKLPAVDKTLVLAAQAAARKAYAPYSDFQVGAAVRLQDGRIVTGNNQENVAYPSGLCAERVVLFYAGAQYPTVPVEAIAVTAYTDGVQAKYISPCGACRQVMLETETRYGHPVKVYLCTPEKIYLFENSRSLLPMSFDQIPDEREK
ncbi:MAG: cytidine deaminase [Tannerellaceae bacterium]|nr:cytidine deaminase [Tannerellaceae bacterium]